MLRTINETDIPELLAIEFSVHPVPWTEETFQSCFAMGCLGWAVIDDNHHIAGFLISSINANECHILNLCVRRPYRRQGFGKKLMQMAISHCGANAVTVIFLEVRRTNFAAICLYEGLGFKEIGQRKNYYPTATGREDALIFAQLLNTQSFNKLNAHLDSVST